MSEIEPWVRLKGCAMRVCVCGSVKVCPKPLDSLCKFDRQAVFCKVIRPQDKTATNQKIRVLLAACCTHFRRTCCLHRLARMHVAVLRCIHIQNEWWCWQTVPCGTLCVVDRARSWRSVIFWVLTRCCRPKVPYLIVHCRYWCWCWCIAATRARSVAGSQNNSPGNAPRCCCSKHPFARALHAKIKVSR